MEHDLFGKPVSTFPDHALKSNAPRSSNPARYSRQTYGGLVATPRTLADVRTLIGHLPKVARAKETWRHVEAEFDNAAAGADLRDLSVALR